MKTKLLTVVTLSLMFLSSCEKDEENSTENSTQNNTSTYVNNTNTGSTASSNTSSNTSSYTDDYLPLNIGNEWTYSGDIAYKSFINNDTVIDGELYFITENDQGGLSYMRKSGDKYLVINELVYNDQKAHVLLQENGEEGDEWGFEISISSYGFVTKNVYTYSIHEKLESFDLNGKTFKDVLVIDADTDTYMDGEYVMSLSDSRYYYAKGVGLIRSKLNQSDWFESFSYSDLIEHTVK